MCYWVLIKKTKITYEIKTGIHLLHKADGEKVYFF